MGACCTSTQKPTHSTSKNTGAHTPVVNSNNNQNEVEKKPQTDNVKAEAKTQIEDPSNKVDKVKASSQPVVSKPEETKKPEVVKEKFLKLKFMYEGTQVGLEVITALETEIFSNIIINSIIDNLPSLSDYSYKDANFQDIDEHKILKDIFSTTSDEVNVVYVVYHGLDIPGNFQQIVSQYSSKTNLIGCPIANSNPFEFRIFCSDNMSLTKASLNIDMYPELNCFGDFSAYCNGNNYLYLSGGEEAKELGDNTMDNKYLNWISKISLIDGKLTRLENFKEARFWHSMIYIPNKYVFVVGGNYTKSVEVVNTETGEISVDSYMNEFHSEASLALVNSNYLYCFLGFKYEGNNEYSNTIERCNLRKKERTWEIVSISTETPINSRFFTISYFNEDQLLFLGGDNIENREVEADLEKSPSSYVFNTKTNEVREYQLETETFNELTSEIFAEKFFIPMKSLEGYLSCLIPKQIGDKLKIYLMKDRNQLEIKEFEDDLNYSSNEVNY